MFAIVLLAGCQKDTSVDVLEMTTMTYSVKAPAQIITRAAGEGDEINVLWYGVYHRESDGKFIYMPDMSAFVTVNPQEDIKVPITLIKNQVYHLVFVAQHRSVSESGEYVYTYEINNENWEMRLNPEVPLTHGEHLDAFVFVDKNIGPITGNENRSIVLQRPFTQVNIGTSAPELPSSFDLELTGVPSSYNLLTGEISQQTRSLELSGITPLGGTITAGANTYSHMATYYIFGGASIGCTIEYETASGTVTKTISGISTAPNYKTNIVGNI